MGISLNRFNGSQITPLDDARLNERIFGQNGMFTGCVLTHLGSNQVQITAGAGILEGRDFKVTQETLLLQLASSGTMPGRIYIHCDLSNSVAPISILSVCATTLPALIQNANFNETNGIWEEELATYTASTTVISALTTTAPQVNRISTWVDISSEITKNFADLSFTALYNYATRKIEMSIQTGGTVLPNETTLLTLPSKYRPSSNIILFGCGSANVSTNASQATWFPCSIVINTDGTVKNGLVYSTNMYFLQTTFGYVKR